MRPEVLVTPLADGVEIWDRLTGFRLAIDADLETGGEELWDALAELGLVDDGTAGPEIRERQREHRQAAVSAAREARLERFLATCRAHAGHYRSDAYRGALAELPLLRKADVRRALNDFVFDDIDVARDLESKRIGFATSSGSTGERLQVYADARLQELPVQGLGLWDVVGAPTRAVFTSPRCVAFECHLGAAAMEERMRPDGTLFLNSTQDPFSLSRALVEGIASELERHRPTVLMGNPVYLHCLVRAAAAFGVSLCRPKLILSSYQFLSRHTRRVLGEAFGVNVVDMYAASDLGASRAGIECSRGRMHVREDHLHLELVGAGELGVAVATTTGNSVLALVRYVLGDVGRFVDVDCDCPLSDWPVIEMHGRTKDMMRLDGAWVTTRQIDDLLWDVPGLDFYQVVQVGPASLAVTVIAGPDRSVDVVALEDRLRVRYRLDRIDVQVKHRLAPQPSLKFPLTASATEKPPELL